MKLHISGEITAIPEGDYTIAFNNLYRMNAGVLEEVETRNSLGSLVRNFGNEYGTIESRETLAKLIERRLLQENNNGRI